MRIKNEKEFNDYKANLEIIIAKGTDLGSMEFLSKEDLDEFDRLTDAIAEYEAAYYPLPGRVSTLLVCAIKEKMKEKGINQKRAAELLSISEKHISDLLCGKGKLDLNIVKRLRDNFGLSADFILDMV